jgi:heme/copper-type cytochrome/quinol oxidase subunit 4
MLFHQILVLLFAFMALVTPVEAKADIGNVIAGLLITAIVLTCMCAGLGYYKRRQN